VDLIRELIGVETLDVKRLYVSNCLINVSPTKLTTVPITIDIDEVDVVLAVRPDPPTSPRWNTDKRASYCRNCTSPCLCHRLWAHSSTLLPNQTRRHPHPRPTAPRISLVRASRGAAI